MNTKPNLPAETPRPNVFDRLTNASIPDISKLPGDALLSRKQLCALTGFSEEAFKKWAREGRGPALTYVENRPRTRVADYRAWTAGAQRVAS